MANKMLEKLRAKAKKSAKTAPDEGGTPAPAAKSSAKTAEGKVTSKKAAKKPTALERIAKKGEGASTAKGETPTAPSASAINPPPKKAAEKNSASKKAVPTTSDSDTVASPAASRSTVFIGCYPVKGAAPEEIVSLNELLADVVVAVQDANSVAHWNELSFSAGSVALASALDAKLTAGGVPEVLYTEPLSTELRAVEHVLLKHYDVVVRGLR